MEGDGSNCRSGEERLLEAFDQSPDPPADSQAPKQKRSKFGPIRRKEVAYTRKKGACIKCHLGKIKCSGEYPCVSCSEAPPRRISKRRWMQCLPFSFRDVNIYALDSPCSQNVYSTIMERTSHCLITDNVQLDFHSECYWNLDTITRDFAQWMSNQQLTPISTSRVGILSSFNLTRLLSTLVPSGMSQNFRLFVETSSALFNRGFQQEYAGYNPIDLWRIRSFTGNKVVEGLQEVLNNNALARASLFELKALFLVLFGTIISVGYSGQLTLSGITDVSRLSKRAFAAAQHQLIRILAHYMVEIADRVQLLGAQSSRNAIIEDAYDQWKQMAAFGWRETYEQESPRYASPASAVQHDIVGSMEFVANLSLNPFFLLDQDLGPHVDETPYNIVEKDQVAEHSQEDITKGFLHDHRRRSSYLLSWPNNCTFVTNNSLPAMIEAYEAQRDSYQRYQITGGAWEHNDNLNQLDFTSHPPPHNAEFSGKSFFHANCNACQGLLDIDGSCAQCISLDTLLLYAQGANDFEAPCFMARPSTPHVVSMQAYDMGARLIDLDPDTDYSITETPPDHALYTKFSQQPPLGRGPGCIDFEGIDDWVPDPSFAKIGEWKCNCASPTSYRQVFLAYRMDHADYDGSHVPSLSTEDRRPLNLLI